MEYRKKFNAVRLMPVLLLIAAISGAVMLGGCVDQTSQEILYENEQFGFSLLIPKDYMEAVEIKETDECVYFVNKEIQATMPEHIFGVVGRIEIYDKSKFTREIIQAGEDAYSLRYLGENENYYFGWAHATDVQWPTQQNIEEFRALEDKFNEIIKTFKIIDITGFDISHEKEDTKKLLCFIKQYDEKTMMLTYDEVEWVMQKDTKRVGELGLNANLDFPNGYYIHNESGQENSLKVSDDVKVYVVNWHDLANPSLTDIKGLAKRMTEHEAPYHLTIKDGVIVEISEQYRP